jgi:opacity protein-like surface antigen
MKATLMLLAALAIAAPAIAQDAPALSIRPFVLATEQSFAAKETFKAAFETSVGPFFGGGVQVVLFDHFVAEIGASRFRMNGQRAFRSGGKTYRLGIPLTTTITPLEITGGYRFTLTRHVRPYGAAGFGRFTYKESSDFADPTALPPARAVDVETRRSGFVANGGVEFRLHQWIGAAADVQYSRVRGILGAGGVSAQAGEHDLGGVAARVKIIVGR